MKNFFSFLSEAKDSEASAKAKRMGLKGDGHGGWYNSQGEFIAKTVGGKLEFFTKGQKPGKDNPNAAAPKAVSNASATKKTADAGAAPQKQAVDTSETDPDGSSVTIVFGRFNPPTVGHKKLLDAAAGVSTGGDLKIYPSRTVDKKKNPLNAKAKIEYMRKMFPKYEEQIVDDDKMKSIFDVLKAADEEGYTDVTIVVGADRLGEFKNLANKYNGDLYDFDMINVVSAGDRDPDAEGVEGMSASKMRKAAAEDDFETFKKGVPEDLEDGDVAALFKKLQGIVGGGKKVAAETWEIAPKFDMVGLREAYYHKNVFTMGTLVENDNTGLVGKVIRRGSNHLICVTEDDMMFKSWIKDVCEKVVNYPGPSGVPGDERLVGTDKNREYVMRMTGSTDIKNFINKYRKK